MKMEWAWLEQVASNASFCANFLVISDAPAALQPAMHEHHLNTQLGAVDRPWAAAMVLDSYRLQARGRPVSPIALLSAFFRKTW
jgi:hypothetical protein